MQFDGWLSGSFLLEQLTKQSAHHHAEADRMFHRQMFLFFFRRSDEESNSKGIMLFTGQRDISQ